jgi:hypothetical protein
MGGFTMVGNTMAKTIWLRGSFTMVLPLFYRVLEMCEDEFDLNSSHHTIDVTSDVCDDNVQDEIQDSSGQDSSLDVDAPQASIVVYREYLGLVVLLDPRSEWTFNPDHHGDG